MWGGGGGFGLGAAFMVPEGGFGCGYMAAFFGPPLLA
jgi:hypothetical protein